MSRTRFKTISKLIMVGNKLTRFFLRHMPTKSYFYLAQSTRTLKQHHHHDHNVKPCSQTHTANRQQSNQSTTIIKCMTLTDSTNKRTDVTSWTRVPNSRLLVSSQVSYYPAVNVKCKRCLKQRLASRCTSMASWLFSQPTRRFRRWLVAPAIRASWWQWQLPIALVRVIRVKSNSKLYPKNGPSSRVAIWAMPERIITSSKLLWTPASRQQSMTNMKLWK